ncbi:TPA: hypothetical protein DD449_03265 [Candidatus Berkelbacteria bacterium]|uniref:Transcription elongation factor GreA/GreB C-terminal domain-containing protein n=1 Tax=Berkelbacteria bacterium GW2011_GWE1_39_12 TaxID=1618337 RepID=A0A0G4B2J7_9BACT|nr:MAG: hypothetical protein UT28_C0001G0283 [Berkelbacteria bacterium GW2011_GWE1_39_12]HBO60678.1 hypothetical protein [Candidatus Berkelbacteria bacterium]
MITERIPTHGTIPITKAALEELKVQLEEARIKRREKRDDLEYAGVRQADALDEQNAHQTAFEKCMLEDRVNLIRIILNNVSFEFIDDMTIDETKVGIGTIVRLFDIEAKEHLDITFLGPIEADTDLDIYNFDPKEVPMAMASNGLGEGDRFTCNNLEYEILEIKRWK